MRRIMIALLMGVAASTAALVTACDTGTEAGAPQEPTTRQAAPPSARGTPDGTATPAAPTPANAPAGVPTGASTGCGQTRGWDTNDQAAAPFSTDALSRVRAGRHECYDRVVLDINGGAEVGYLVHYVPVVTVDGSGARLPVAGRAALEVVVRAPAQGFDNGGHQPWRILAETGDYFYTPAQLAGWESLRAVRFAGYFEGQSTLGVGVSEKLPFRVFTQLDTTDQIRRVVIDIAHER